MSEIKNQGEAVYNVDWGHDGIFWRCLTVKGNHNKGVKFTPYIDPTKLQLSHLILFRYLIYVVLLNNINERVEGEKFSYG